MARRKKHRKHARKNPTKRRRARSRRRNPGALMVNPRRKHHRRRRNNPGMIGGIKASVFDTLKLAPAALGAGFVMGIVDSKTASKGVVIRVAGKVAVAIGVGMLAGKFLGSRAKDVAIGAALGSLGHEFGAKVSGGMVTQSVKITGKSGVSELLAAASEEDGAMSELLSGTSDGDSYLPDLQGIPAAYAGIGEGEDDLGDDGDR